MHILGIWDGHDAGAALIEDGAIKVAINEERLTRRKLEVGFPRFSIMACLAKANLKPSDISHIAYSTTDFSKTLTRTFPSLKEKYYMFRRRKVEKPRFTRFQHFFKYRTTQFGNCFGICQSISSLLLEKELKKMGFAKFKLYPIEHHKAHAAAVCYTSGFAKALCITLDGVGDKLSGSVNVFENGEIKRLSSISAHDSLGIFFEQVTNLIGFRELEDEGKVMSMADYSYPIDDSKNKFMDFFKVNGLNIKAKYSASKSYQLIDKVLWNHPREQVAYMAQKVLEKNAPELFGNALKETGISDVCWTGGLASNIKMNMKIRALPELKSWYVFPHMGDGGLAAGAALAVSAEISGPKVYRLENSYLGNSFTDSEIEQALKENNLPYENRSDIAEYCAELISKENFVFWFQDGMEFGPRALGNRSILASSMSENAKDNLNVKIKKREWYQPFCPSMLEEEALRILDDVKGIDRFMTMGYMLKDSEKTRFKAISNIDNSCRPQMVGSENQIYRKLLEELKKRNGYGVVLNTSFNIHGDPIVCSPGDAIETLKKSKHKYLAIGNFMVETGS